MLGDDDAVNYQDGARWFFDQIAPMIEANTRASRHAALVLQQTTYELYRKAREMMGIEEHFHG